MSLSIVILIIGIIIYMVFYGMKKISAKEIALLSTMATFAAIARVPFAAIISLQPTTFVVMITGYVFGPSSGFMVGAISAFVSNMYLGQGPWTPWQMFSWGLCGVLAGLLGKAIKEYKPLRFILLSIFCGFLFGWIMNIWHWMSFVYPLSLNTFLATYIVSLPFDAIHAFGNGVFTLLFGHAFYKILTRYKNKIQITRIYD